MFDHLSIDLAHHLRSIINTIADLGRPHGAINSNNIFLVGEGLKAELKLGMCSLNPQTSDIQQFDRMVRGLDLNPFPYELDQLLQTLTNGQCLTYPFPAEQWRAKQSHICGLISVVYDRHTSIAVERVQLVQNTRFEYQTEVAPRYGGSRVT